MKDKNVSNGIKKAEALQEAYANWLKDVIELGQENYKTAMALQEKEAEEDTKEIKEKDLIKVDVDISTDDEKEELKKTPPTETTKTPPKFADLKVKARLRAVSWLWDTTVPSHLNPFSTDGTKSVPNKWPGDSYKKCRQWHGIDLGYNLKGGVPVDITVKTTDYVGVSGYCGVKGHAFKTNSWTSKPKLLTDTKGAYIEVKSLLGSRVGVYIPDIDVGVPRVEEADNVVTAFLWAAFSPVTHLQEEFVEQMAEEGYTGTNSAIAKIYDYIRLKLYTDGTAVGEYVSEKAANGFQTTNEIISGKIGYSWAPEHHLYLDDKKIKSVIPKSSDGYPEFVKWIDSNRPFEVYATTILTRALKEWCANATAEDKAKMSNTFKKLYPDYHIG